MLHRWCKIRGIEDSHLLTLFVQDYVRVLGRPLVLSGEETKDLFHWHNVYMDKGVSFMCLVNHLFLNYKFKCTIQIVLFL